VSEHTVEQLFDAFAHAYLRGESPDVSEYLARAGGERDALGDLIDRLLTAVPAQPATEEEIVLMQARLEREPALLVLRRRRGLKREAVVRALVERLRLDPAKSAKVRGYYDDLEVGLLDPEPVSSRVWDALGELLHANVRVLAGLRPPSPAAEGAVFHRLELHERISAFSVRKSLETSEVESELIEEPELPDEVDRLFTGTV
jgi:hypothetical protein